MTRRKMETNLANAKLMMTIQKILRMPNLIKHRRIIPLQKKPRKQLKNPKNRKKLKKVGKRVLKRSETTNLRKMIEKFHYFAN